MALILGFVNIHIMFTIVGSVNLITLNTLYEADLNTIIVYILRFAIMTNAHNCNL